ncbi:MAG: methyltransferase domain-containing protein [Thermosynechococcaceae cyanobacterium]
MRRTMLLQPHQRTKLDETQDDLFYDYPRFVTHVDDNFIKQLTQVYRDRIPANARVLDLMSSWVSHLPDEVTYSHVEGHGLNAVELAKNPRLDHFFVQNLNENPKLTFEDQSFDAVLMAVSVQYLQYPEAVLSEVQRVLMGGGVAIVSFSNRMFYQKAIQAWRDSGDQEHLQMVRSYFEAVAGFKKPEVIVNQPEENRILAMFNIAVSDPFFAVVAQREED